MTEPNFRDKLFLPANFHDKQKGSVVSLEPTWMQIRKSAGVCGFHCIPLCSNPLGAPFAPE
eukprot:4628706-Amphidinium_carterae.1